MAVEPQKFLFRKFFKTSFCKLNEILFMFTPICLYQSIYGFVIYMGQEAKN